MPLSGILGGFETRQKQFFHIFGAREKIRKFFFQEKFVFFWEKSGFIGKNRFLSEKSVIFLRFFYFRCFHPKIFSNTTEIRFFSEKSDEIDDFFVHAYTNTEISDFSMSLLYPHRNSGYLLGSLTPTQRFRITPRVSYTHTEISNFSTGLLHPHRNSG